MRYQILDLSDEVIGEFDDYTAAAEWLMHINDQMGPVARLVFLDE